MFSVVHYVSMDYRHVFTFDKATFLQIIQPFGVSKVVFFGSVLRGYVGPHSDIDVVIVCNTLPHHKKSRHILFDPYRKQLYQHFHKPLDITLITDQEYVDLTRDFLNGVEHEEIVL